MSDNPSNHPDAKSLLMDPLSVAIIRLQNVGRAIVEQPAGRENHEAAASAVAEYLEFLARERLPQTTYTFQAKPGLEEKTITQTFTPADWKMWEELAQILRNPLGRKTIEIASAWETCMERSDRIGRTSKTARNPLELTFGWAASYVSKTHFDETGISLGVPKHLNSTHRAQYLFIP